VDRRRRTVAPRLSIVAHHALDVCFDIDLAADLGDVAMRCGCSVATLVDLLCGASLTVERIGFLPGFPYLSGLPEVLHLPRRDEPRPSVPAGSVALANGQAGIYPTSSPGGWHLVGRTPARMFDVLRTPPSLLLPDDTVQFRAISRVAFDAAMQTAPPTRSMAAPDARVLRIVRPGAQTTVEDGGRPGYDAYGVADGGVSDRAAMQLANALVGNALDAAVLECTLAGPTFTCTEPLLLAVTGADAAVHVDDAPVPCHPAIAVPAGATVQIGRCLRGARAIVAIGGGIDVPLVLGSRSTHRLSGFGGFEGRALQVDDLLPLGAPSPRTEARRQNAPRRALSRDLLGAPLHGREPHALRFVPGEAWTAISADAQRLLLGDGHAARLAPDSDRMGVRLDTPLPGGIHDPLAGMRPSVPVQRGTIQLPPGGVPIILGADHQTTGGYAILGTLIDADHATLAQLRPGDAVRLSAIDDTEAAQLNAKRARHLATALAALHLPD